jgi:hypothetical protein
MGRNNDKEIKKTKRQLLMKNVRWDRNPIEIVTRQDLRPTTIGQVNQQELLSWRRVK